MRCDLSEVSVDVSVRSGPGTSFHFVIFPFETQNNRNKVEKIVVSLE